MGGSGPNPETKTTEDPKGAPAVAPEVATKPIVKARGEAAEKTAQPQTVVPDAPKAAEIPFDNPEGLPDNQWSRQYYELQQQVKANPNMQGPLMSFALIALKLAAKYAKYVDLMPGAFSERVEKSEELKDKKLTPEEAKALVDAHLKQKTPEEKNKDEENSKKELAALKEKEVNGGPKLGIERASTKFVTNVLWNIDDITDTGTLAASLLHTTKGGEPLYKQMDVGKDDINKLAAPKRGTLIIFVPNFKNGEKVVAYATGVEDEFKYYDLESAGNPVRTFKLKDGDSPLKKPQTPIQMVMLPNVEAYRDAKEEVPVAAPAPAAAPAEDKTVNPEELFMKNLDKVDGANQNLAKMIVDYLSKPNPDNLPIIKTIAKGNFDAVEALKNDEEFKKLEDKSKTDDFNVVKLTASVDAANKNVTTDGSEANVKAYTDAVKKLGIAKKIQENFARVQKIKDETKKNYNDAEKLK